MKKLNCLPSVFASPILTPIGVNDSGMIVGWGYYNGIARAFVAVPGTPPPPPQDPE